jgi:uncharacterized delta-60 repeat protein
LEFVVRRFNADGSFTTNGIISGLATTSFSAGDDVGSGIAVQSDDKIVVVGTSDDGSGASEFAVARFNVNGSLDNTFDIDGKVTTSFFAGNDVGSGIAVQSDDKMGIIGTSDDLGTTWFAVGRLNLDGSFDTTFSGDGKVLTKFSLTGDDIGLSIAVQSDDKIVVAGADNDASGTFRFAVARFNIDGSFASTADGFGKVTTNFSAGDDLGSGIAVQSDDRIVVAGTIDNGSGTSEFAVARYLLDLPLDGGDDGGGGGGGGGSSCFIATAADGSLMQP